ncbi:MAG: hypothetical protein JWL88_90 [Parcubacteria group bacterium]|nr:hypothetical protein [Parcubacteria group bacterium]
MSELSQQTSAPYCKRCNGLCVVDDEDERPIDCPRCNGTGEEPEARRNPPEVSDLITESLLSGQMSDAEYKDLMKEGCDEGDGSYQWMENGIEYRSWNDVKSEYRSAETQWRWKPYTD